VFSEKTLDPRQHFGALARHEQPLEIIELCHDLVRPLRLPQRRGERPGRLAGSRAGIPVDEEDRRLDSIDVPRRRRIRQFSPVGVGITDHLFRPRQQCRMQPADMLQLSRASRRCRRC
jgi:hypothetical protein